MQFCKCDQAKQDREGTTERRGVEVKEERIVDRTKGVFDVSGEVLNMLDLTKDVALNFGGSRLDVCGDFNGQQRLVITFISPIAFIGRIGLLSLLIVSVREPLLI
jgi:hypothetical protein